MDIGRIESRQDRSCPVCGNSMRMMVDLPRYPLTEIYEPYRADTFANVGFVDQAFLFCEGCSHGKLETVISTTFLYEHYRTATASSIGSINAIRNFQAFVVSSLNVDDFDTIVDIGANDATLLSTFSAMGKQCVAIDPNTDKRLEDEFGIRVMSDFIENVDLAALGSSRKLFLCSHTLEHIDQPSSVLSNLRDSMSDGDVCVFQFPSLDLLVRDARFDQIHHQHVHYFSERSISLLLERGGFEVGATKFDPDHYGTLMVVFSPASRTRSNGVGRSIPATVITERKAVFDADVGAVNFRMATGTRKLIAFGAGLMLPLVAYYIPALELVECIVDEDPAKEGLRFINFNKRITRLSDVNLAGRDIVVTAIATKLAMRRILTKLFALNVENVIIPLSQL
ncbi:MAG TPA: class I SAM-dependent methyltransferase [Gemmatimonadaceae bacterium]|nr:class I SAM-dependent methyltransferase [Gemmatimonadaceae bacterium]